MAIPKKDKFFYGDNNRWFIGKVVNVSTPPDPLKLGRIQVRILGIHDGITKEDIPDDKLPWAQVLTPITEGGTGGLGSNLGIQKGARVFGVFLDGEESQTPLVFGALPKVEEIKNEKISDVSTSKRARNINEIEKTDDIITQEPKAKNVFKPIYPFNKVHQTERGHMIEIDDSHDSDGKGNITGYERIHIYHRTGTYIEMQANGDVVTHHKNGFRTVTGNDKLHVTGDLNWQVDGNINISCLNNIQINSLGMTEILNKGLISLSSKSDIYGNAAGNAYLRGTQVHLNDISPPVVSEPQINDEEEPQDQSPGGATGSPVDENGNSTITDPNVSGPMTGADKNQSEPTPVDWENAGKCGRKNLGSVSKKHESRGDPGVRGYDPVGGYSYGSYQIAASRGNMQKFMNYLQTDSRYSDKGYHTTLENAGGDAAARQGTSQFNSAFKNLAKDEDFAQAHHDWIASTHYFPAVTKIKDKTGIDICDGKWSNGLQDAVWSTAVQHGSGGTKNRGAWGIVSDALKATGKTADTVTDKELIQAIYDTRYAATGNKNANGEWIADGLYMPKFPSMSSTADGRQQLANMLNNRAPDELNEALALSEVTAAAAETQIASADNSNAYNKWGWQEGAQ